MTAGLTSRGILQTTQAGSAARLDSKLAIRVPKLGRPSAGETVDQPGLHEHWSAQRAVADRELEAATERVGQTIARMCGFPGS